MMPSTMKIVQPKSITKTRDDKTNTDILTLYMNMHVYMEISKYVRATYRIKARMMIQ